MLLIYDSYHNDEFIVFLVHPLIELVTVCQPSAADPPLLGNGGTGFRSGSTYLREWNDSIVAAMKGQEKNSKNTHKFNNREMHVNGVRL